MAEFLFWWVMGPLVYHTAANGIQVNLQVWCLVDILLAGWCVVIGWTICLHAISRSNWEYHSC